MAGDNPATPLMDIRAAAEQRAAAAAQEREAQRKTRKSRPVERAIQRMGLE
jgi:hypothetical protein